MKYGIVKKGTFLNRPNRFIAHVEMDGEEVICHVKNTGRCRELLQLGAAVFLEEAANPARKTKYDVIAVMKGQVLVNMDSQAPNKAVAEHLKAGKLDEFLGGHVTLVKPETVYGNSRFDLYVEVGERKIFIEVKGVTLETEGVAEFPDAPTERGLKHIRELAECGKDGYEGMIFFVIQMKGIRYFTPNDRTQPEFRKELRKAAKAGVRIAAFDCMVTEDELWMDQEIEVRL